MASTMKHPVLCLLFIVVATAAFIPPGSSELEPSPSPLSPELAPGQLGIGECWSTVRKVEGCFVEVIKAINEGKVGEIGTSCCQAILSIADKCWPEMLPLHPFVPALLKNFCSGASFAFAPAPTLF
ncbi:egg cell-secreted protein 1.4-like [Mercurialis annua]|uniref:egg cell-secreted protein 1.4-like n=1 Tax=Mercurialis annua TaxID=3986 RepID=UPI00215EBBE8|nr:egg cell-secreted protein 1.4-like [Mercurialis annua]